MLPVRGLSFYFLKCFLKSKRFSCWWKPIKQFIFYSLYFFLLYNNFLPNPVSLRPSLTFSAKSWIILAILFSSMNHFKLIFVFGVKSRSRFRFCTDVCIFPEPFVEGYIFLLIDLGTLVKNQLIISMGTLFSAELISMSTLIPTL